MSGHAFPEGGDKGKEKRLIPAEGTTTQLISTGNLQQPIRYPPEILATLSVSIKLIFVFHISRLIFSFSESVLFICNATHLKCHSKIKEVLINI